jgi:drug/metabolite transporter (DMT)-like permease
MLAAIFASLSFALQNLACKEYGKRFPTGLAGLCLLNLPAMAIVCALMSLRGGAAAVSPAVFLTAALFGAMFIATFFLMIAAMAAGPLGITTLIVNVSMLIPAVVGLIFWNETLTISKGVGIVLILLLLALTALHTRDNTQASMRWLLLSISAFIGNGSLSLLQHTMSLSFPGVSAAVFTFWASAVSGLICLAILAWLRLRGSRVTQWTGSRLPLALCSLGVGLGTAGGNFFSIVALAAVPAFIMFPLRQGLLVLTMWLAGVVLYGEKLQYKNLLAPILGFCGLILLSAG